MPEVDPARLKARLATVEEHVRCENRHDLAGLLATSGDESRYDDAHAPITALVSTPCARTTPDCSRRCPIFPSMYDIGT